jgi:hypothetical protein
VNPALREPGADIFVSNKKLSYGFVYPDHTNIKYVVPSPSTSITEDFELSCLGEMDIQQVPKLVGKSLSYVFHTISGTSLPILLVSILWLYFTGSFFFDVAHYLLHKCSISRYRALRGIGYLHQVHHLYFNRRLQFNSKYLWQNTCIELPLELSCQFFGTWLGYLAVQALRYTGPGLLSREILYLIFIFETIRVLVVAILEGVDSNHKSYATTVPKDPNTFLVGPQYHALHHIDPSAYISSSFRVFDWLLGTSYSVRSRRVALTGASGAFGSALKKQLQGQLVRSIQELKFGVDWNYEDYSRIISVLTNTDILILAHGSKGKDEMQANCTSAISFIELFKINRKSRPGDLLLPEVWYVGSEIEVHPTWGLKSLKEYSKSKRAFAKHARKYYDDETLVYRHIVPSAFRSRMGGSIVRPEWAVRVALWWIRRGARYVPVTYTGLAFWGYLKFIWWVEKD